MGRDTDIHKAIDDIVNSLSRTDAALCIKNARGLYTFANEAWTDLAEVPNHLIAGKHDLQLPWGPTNGGYIEQLDASTRRYGKLISLDRRPHFQERTWFCASIEKIYVPDKSLLATAVKALPDDDFSTMAGKVDEGGIEHSGFELSVKQLYLLHQLLFHVPHKQTARELGCSVNRIQQHLREIREQFEAEDSKELVCALSAHGFFPLLEHFDLLFRHRWLADELRYH